MTTLANNPYHPFEGNLGGPYKPSSDAARQADAAVNAPPRRTVMAPVFYPLVRRRRGRRPSGCTSAASQAEAFLQQAFPNGPKPTNRILMEAERMNISERTLRTVKKRLGIESCREGSGWVWLPPEKVTR